MAATSKTVVHRKGYERRAFTEKRGGKLIQEPSAYVRSTEYMEPWQRIEPKVYLKVRHPGELSSEGYAVHEGVEQRHAALLRAVDDLGYAKVVKALTNLRVWNKRLHPAITRIAQEDYNWLERRANA